MHNPTTQFRHCRRLSLLALLTAFVLMAAAVGFNWLVDPYGVYGTPRVEGFNKVKNRLHKNARYVKAMRLYDHRPPQVILGTSRSEYGLHPDHPAWETEKYGECYNAALSGANIYEMYRYFAHAAELGTVTRAVAGLDFFSFNIYCQDAIGDLDARLAVGRDGRAGTRLDYLLLKYRNLLSLDMVEISWDTVGKQGEKEELILANGGRADVDISGDIAGGGGNRAAFEKNVRTYYGFGYLPRPYKAYTTRYAEAARRDFPNPDKVDSTLAYFRRMVNLAYRRNVDLRLVISPSHAWQWETIRAAGLWEEFEDWKRALVGIVHEEAAAAGKNPFPLWDFADYSPPTREEVPPLGDSTLMNYYWESSHFRKELGDLVLDRVLGGGAESGGDFGILLTAGDVEQHLLTIRSRAAAYAATHAGDIARIREIWAEEAGKAQ